MTEAQARQLIVEAAKSYLGFSEASGKQQLRRHKYVASNRAHALHG